MSSDYKETMFNDETVMTIDVIALERQARELRAKVIRSAVRSLARRIAARFGGRGASIPASAARA